VRAITRQPKDGSENQSVSASFMEFVDGYGIGRSREGGIRGEMDLPYISKCYMSRNDRKGGKTSVGDYKTNAIMHRLGSMAGNAY